MKRSFFRKLVTRSRYLQVRGISLEVYWMPEHAKIHGTSHADVTARHAAESSTQSSEEELIQPFRGTTRQLLWPSTDPGNTLGQICRR